MTAEITVYGPFSKITGDFPLKAVREATSYPVEGAEFSPTYRKGLWDGRKHLFKTASGTFPTGLLDIVTHVLDVAGTPYTVTDHRTTPEPQGRSYDLVGAKMEGKYDYQLDAAQQAIARKQGILRIATNGGKCLHPDTEVRLFNGSVKTAGAVVPGDQLMGPDNRPRTVLSVCTGQGPMYRIVPRRGKSWICNDVHVLTLQHTETNEVIDIPLNEYLAESEHFKHCYKQFSVGVEYPQRNLPVDPYFIGLWLGDGSKSLKTVAVTTADAEIEEYLGLVADSYGLSLYEDDHPDNASSTYHLTVGRTQKPNKLLQDMRSLFNPENVRIPHDYLTASFSQRKQLLAGLIDSDGHLHENRYYEIEQVRKGLADDIYELARSLGFGATIRPKTVNGITYWRVNILGAEFGSLPHIRLRRKQITSLRRKHPNRTAFEVESLGIGDYAGFTLDGDGRFLLADYTVTHNTEISCAITAYLKLRTIFIVTTRELLYQARERFKKRLGVGDKEVGIVGDGVWSPGSWVTIATADTLESRFEKKECQELLKSCDVLFVDECVDEYSIISTERGYKYACNIVVGDRVITHAGIQTVTRTSNHTRTGVQISTYAGIQLRCSNEHPVAVWRDGKIQYVYADSLTVNDYVVEKLNPTVEAYTDNRAYLAGLFAGDGHWHTKNKVRWAYRKDFEFWEDTIKSLVETTYPDACTHVAVNSRGDHSLTVESPTFLKDLSDLGFACRQNKHLHLPLHPCMSSYIAGLFDAEGNIDRKTGKLHLQTTCKELMQGIHRYLRDMEVAATFQECPKKLKKHNTGYRVNIPSSQVDLFNLICTTHLTRKKLTSECRKYKHLNSGTVISPGVFAHKISAILHGIQLNTVEFEIENDHTFVANGLITHNCHHAGSETWYDVCTACPAVYRFGLSGTPMDRTDGANIRLLAAIGPIIVDIPNKFLVDRGISARTHIIFSRITAPVLPKKLPYPSAYKQGVVENPNGLALIVEWTKVFQEVGLSTLILCEQIEHGKIIDNALWTATDGVFIPHLFIHGTEDTEVRAGALKDFGDRKLPVLIASTILDEGVDVPTIDALILAGSRKSRIKTMQRLGRGLRGDKLICVEFANFTHQHLLEHSLHRYEDYKKEECFPLFQSQPDVQLIKRLWNGQDNGATTR